MAKKRRSNGPVAQGNSKSRNQAKKGYTAPKGRATNVAVHESPRNSGLSANGQWALIAGVIGVLVVGLVGFAVYSSARDAGTGVTDLAVWDLPVLDDDADEDQRIRLVDFTANGTPVVVNFFASWCTACDAELPDFSQTATEFAGEVEFVFVNSNETGNWRPMATRGGILDLTIAKDVGGTQRNGLYRSLGGTGGMPMTAFFDGEGNLLQVDRGALNLGTLRARISQFYGVTVG